MKMGLMIHCGAKFADKDEVFGVDTPDSTQTHYPIPHKSLIEKTESMIEKINYQIAESSFALNKGGQQMFGIYELKGEKEEYNTVVGIRNSHDKTFACGAVLGNRTFVCDNLAFTGEYVFSKKHTVSILEVLDEKVEELFQSVPHYENYQNNLLHHFKKIKVSKFEARSFVVEMAKQKVLPSSRILPVIKEWEKPSFKEFEQDGYSMFRLKQAFTSVMKRNKNIFTTSKSTVKLNQKLVEFIGEISTESYNEIKSINQEPIQNVA